MGEAGVRRTLPLALEDRLEDEESNLLAKFVPEPTAASPDLVSDVSRLSGPNTVHPGRADAADVSGESRGELQAAAGCATLEDGVCTAVPTAGRGNRPKSSWPP